MIVPLALFSIGLVTPIAAVGSSFLADRFAKNYFLLITLTAGAVIAGVAFTVALFSLTIAAAFLVALPSCLVTVGILYHDLSFKQNF